MKGLVKGAFHGLAGAVLKPAVGTVDFFTRTAEGLRSATGGAAGPLERVRAPREFGEDGVVRVNIPIYCLSSYDKRLM